MAYDARGIIKVIGETKQISQKFSKRDLVLEIPDGKYPQTVAFELTNDRCQEVDHLNVGEEVRVTFDIRGREWRSPQGDTKYFVSLNVWKVEGIGDALSNDRRDRERDTGRDYGPRDSMRSGGARDDDPFAPSNHGRVDDDIPF